MGKESPDPPPLPTVPPIFRNRRAMWLAVLGVAALVVVFGLGFLAFDTLVSGLSRPRAIRETVAGYGPLAPLAFIALQVLQIVIAPVPGQVLALAGGYLFGTALGTLYSLLGATIGSAIAFGLSRRFGRPAVERLVHPETLSRFDGFLEDHGRLAVFLVFVLPGLPDDALCFVCGLTPIPLRWLVVLSALGRLPGYALMSFAGSRLATHRPVEAVVVLLGLAGVTVLVYWGREPLFRLLGRR
ncbi:MAG: TVP38/TMEM64 family protein [Halodesulfurarchaeum sp.]